MILFSSEFALSIAAMSWPPKSILSMEPGFDHAGPVSCILISIAIPYLLPNSSILSYGISWFSHLFSFLNVFTFSRTIVSFWYWFSASLACHRTLSTVTLVFRFYSIQDLRRIWNMLWHWAKSWRSYKCVSFQSKSCTICKHYHSSDQCYDHVQRPVCYYPPFRWNVHTQVAQQEHASKGHPYMFERQLWNDKNIG